MQQTEFDMHSPITRRTFLGTSMGVLASLALYGCGTSNTIPATEEKPAEEASQASGFDDGKSKTITKPIDNGYSSGIHHATIEVKDFGTIKLELDADVAPISVSNFAQLAKDGFYDGLTFHRIIKGFMIQGGDPKGDGTGGSERQIKGEFSSNGVDNPRKHVRGTVSMARTLDPDRRGVISMARSNDNDSGSSQFFIMHEDTPSLNGQYAAFGKVTEGMDVVDAIAEKTPVQDSNGTVAKQDQPVITSIKMDD